MAKGKSSASSGTRKKHARKATAAHGPINEPPAPTEKKPKGKEKGSKRSKEPRKKVYIPPVKPAPVQPDPLDTLGIAQKIPPDLLVVLRRLAKKDFTTKRRALEDLKTGWVEKARMEDDEGPLVQALIDAIPVWVCSFRCSSSSSVNSLKFQFHHLPVLFTHPSRRIRLLAIGLHRNLLDLSGPISTQLLFYLSDVADVSQAESILSAWCMLAHDVDRQVSAYARLSWDKYVLVTQSSSSSSGSRLVIDWESFTRIWNFIHRTILDPGGVYLYLNPPQPAAPLPPRKAGTRALQTPKREEEQSRTKSEEEEESEADRKARLRIGAFGAAEWVLSGYTLSIYSWSGFPTHPCDFRRHPNSPDPRTERSRDMDIPIG